ncbi:MAG: RHS repeat-associated core domain-containing protein, partial [Blastocatellia bacterium]
DEPLSGVTVSIDGQSATTDAAGAFLLSGVLAGNQRAVMVDGRTASSPGTSYPVIAEPVDIIANQPNQMPYTFYLPRIDTQFEVTVVPNQDTIVTTPRVNNLQTLIPAGANLRNRDGSPVTRVSMTPVAIDKTPAPLPANVSTNLVYTNQPGGAIADVAMPVIYPNLGGLDPGTTVNLYTFNHDTVEWEIYGFGKVSSDGRTISPEIDPATNKPYGLRDFSWHLVDTSCDDDCDSDNDTCSNPEANGVQTDIGAAMQPSFGFSLGGARGGLSFSGMYSTKYLTSKGYLGFGTRMNYEVRLTGSFAQGGAGRIAWPQDKNGWLFNYSGTDTDGALVFTSTAKATLLGDKIRKLSNGTLEYISKNGDKMEFDSNGRLTDIVDRNNNTTVLTYSGNNLAQVTDPVGRSMNLIYDGQDRIIQVTDPIGRSWTFTYTTTGGIAGILATVTDPLGHTVRYGYTALGQLETVTDKRNNIVRRITYDLNGRVTSQTWADGGVETYQYFFAGSKVSAVRITDPENRVTVKRFNGMGYVIFELDGLGQPSRITRDINTNLSTQTNGPCGCAENATIYDSKANVITVVDRLGQIMRYEYDNTFSFVTKVTDKNGHITRFTYDSRGNRTSVINAKGETTTFAYDSFGQQTSMTDALNHTWSMGYDSQGNVISKSDPLSNTSTMTYDGIGRMLSMSDPLGRISSMVYDQMNRVTSQTDPANATTTFTYDQNGNQTAMMNALNNTWTMLFDSKNRMISKKFPLTPSDNGIQREMRMEYNKNNELLTSISPSGRNTRFTYDARGQKKMVIDPLGGVVTYNYDINRNLISLKDQRNNATTFSYDELYRVIKVTDPSGKYTTTSYDSEGNMINQVDRLSRSITVSYDELDRPSTVQYVDATLTWQYDAVGRRTRAEDTQFEGSFISWAYDNANRLLSETTREGVVSYTYNQSGQKITMTATNRPVVNYVYDSAGRLSTISQNLGQGIETFTYNYDILSRRISLQRPNDVTTTYDYDGSDRLNRLKHQKNTNLVIENFQYNFNADDEIKSSSSLFFTRLEPPSTVFAEADVNNRILVSDGVTNTFDNLGQMISKNKLTGGNIQYQWDHRGRLIRVSLPNGQIVDYKYDALDRRVSQSTVSTTTKFLYDDQEVIIDFNDGEQTTHYLNGLSTDEKLCQTNSLSDHLYFLSDNINSTVALTNSVGDLVERISYGPFGIGQGSAFTRYNYTGRELDSATGIYFLRARWLDSQDGRFLSEDPLGILNVGNLYSYTRNNPISKRDPFGLIENAEYPEDAKCKPLDSCPPGTSCQGKFKWFFSLMPLFCQLSQKLNVDVNLLLALSAFENGYLVGDNFNAMRNCNPFGLTRGGGKNLSFGNWQEVFDYFFKNYESYFKDCKDDVGCFIDAMKKIGYNSANPG